MTVCTANRMFPLFFQLLLLMRERECKYLSSFSLLFIYSINFWWIDVFFRKWKNIISTKVNRQYYGSLETDIICFMEKFVYETGSWTINSECHNGLYKCAVWTLFAKTLSPIVFDNFDVDAFSEYSLLVSKGDHQWVAFRIFLIKLPACPAKRVNFRWNHQVWKLQ